MPKLSEHQSLHREDVERIMRVCAMRRLPLSFFDAYAVWRQHSENYAAGWLLLPDNEENLFEIVKAVANG